MLDQTFGQYLRGDVLVYRGTVQGSAMGATPPGYDTVPEETIAAGPAFARLAFAPGLESDWIVGSSAHAPFVDGNQAMLTVHSLANDQYMVFEQPESDPSMTATSGIAMVRTTNLLTPTCSGCAPSFWTRPATIAFDLSAAGTVTTVTAGADATTSIDQPVTTTASVQLTVVPPCTLTFDNFETLNEVTGPSEFSAVGLASFVLTGGEWIWHTGSTVETKPPSSHGQCDGQSFSYTIELYVNAANLGDFGVRNYVQGPTQSVCAI